jgi:hypothetical protein
MVPAMKRSTLRRYIERVAMASLLSSGCGHPRSYAADPPSPPADMGGVGAPGDLACPGTGDNCYWLAYVDGGVPSDKIRYWLGDGSADPCPACNFGAQPGATCGSCEVVSNSCGNAYFCSILNCSLYCTGAGRRPPGLLSPLLAGDDLAARLATMAHLEAASVPAFMQLEHELMAHGAPGPLIAAARRARADEVRHAEVMTALARRAGARPLAIDVMPTPLRPLAELALENAVEGCVRETAGAVVAAAQARTLRDPELARVFAAIAVDERRHADLAWAVDAWVTPRLLPAERRRIERARATAVQDLEAA